jgi:glycosyltransferase involved in cell wall biosynthesis
VNILAHVHKAPPEHNAGAEWMLLTIGRELVRRGHEFTIYASHNRRATTLDGVRIVPRSPTRRLDELHRHADLVITHLDETRRAVALAGRHGRPVVHLVHNDRQLTYHGITPAAAALVVLNSRWIADTAGWPGPSLVVHPPVFAADYRTTPGDRVTLLNLSEAKGGPLFFDLAERMPDVGFLAVRGAYAAQHNPRGPGRNVEVIGNTAHVVRDVYARTRILLVPSSYESWGRVAIEAAASGIPTIAHPTPGLLESLGPAGIFVDRNDPAGWEREIRRLLDDADHYTAASRRAITRAAELDPTAQLDALDAELRRLVDVDRRRPVDFAAHTAPYVEHLAPIYRAMPPEHRGIFYVTSWARARAVELGIPEDELVIDDGHPLPAGAEIVVASYRDLTRARDRPVILCEHGAGQAYSNRHSSYVGGVGREPVVLFVVPNDQAAERNRRRYPFTPNAVVGCPKLDELLTIPAPAGPPTVAISFHWRCDVAPEAGTALGDYRPVLGELRHGLAAAGIDLIGHGHPGIAGELEAVYAEVGIEFVPSFVDVVRRAHLYAVDNSSTLFEFAALGRPVVVLNARRYRRGVRHGLRFWTEAGVGLNVDDPAELLPTILAALEDPDGVRRSRESSVARVYPVRDGTSARRAAAAVVAVVAKRCLVCGAAHASCGGPTDVVPVDEQMTRSERVPGPLKRYPNPARAGAYLKLDEETARRMGLTGEPVEPLPALLSSKTAAASSTSRQEPPGALAGPGRPAASSAAGPRSGPSVPKGAIPPGGVTHRARAAARATEEATMAEEPAPAPETPETPETPEVEPQDKKRPAPSSRRRRKISE